MNRTHNNLSSSEDDFQTEGFDKKFNESNAPSGGMSTSIRTQARQIGRPQSRIDFIGRSWTQLSLRLLALIAGIIVLLIAASLPGILPAEDIECIKDVGFEITSSSNKYFEDHRSSKHAFMIICGLAMDVTVLCGLLSFVIKGKTWRLPIVMVLFYFTRMVVQKIFLMKFPEGYIWEYPGFPSLTVPYGRTNDFFYSGHIGGCVIMILEFRARSKEEIHQKILFRGLQILAIFTAFLQLFVLLITRTHYSIDLFAGALAAHYFFIIVSGWMPYIDTVLCRLKKKDLEKRDQIRRLLSKDTFSEDCSQNAHSPLVEKDCEYLVDKYCKDNSGGSID